MLRLHVGPTQQVLTDLWQTRTDSPFPGLTTHAFLWTTRNALFYSTASDADFPSLETLGGIADQYLSHRDEAGPMPAKIADQFDSSLHAPVAELLEIGQHARSSAGESPCRRQRHRSHPDTGALPGQHLLFGQRSRRHVPIHR